MAVRDDFALAVLPSVYGKSTVYSCALLQKEAIKQVARTAYAIADAMIEERDKRNCTENEG